MSLTDSVQGATCTTFYRECRRRRSREVKKTPTHCRLCNEALLSVLSDSFQSDKLFLLGDFNWRHEKRIWPRRAEISWRGWRQPRRSGTKIDGPASQTTFLGMFGGENNKKKLLGQSFFCSLHLKFKAPKFCFFFARRILSKLRTLVSSWNVSESKHNDTQAGRVNVLLELFKVIMTPLVSNWRSQQWGTLSDGLLKFKWISRNNLSRRGFLRLRRRSWRTRSLLLQRERDAGKEINYMEAQLMVGVTSRGAGQGEALMIDQVYDR